MSSTPPRESNCHKYLASLEGFEPTCVHLAFLRFRKSRAYSDMRELRKCERDCCDRLTPNARFCSRSCAVSTNNKIPKRRAKVHTCSCGRELKYRKTCSQCVALHRHMREQTRLTLQERTLGSFVVKNVHNHPSWKYAEVRAHCRSTNSHLVKRCQMCGYDKHVEMAHIVALCEWPLTATLAEVNHERNILVLCRNHHWEFDHGLIELSAVPAR